MAVMEWGAHILIPGCAIAGIVFAIFMWIRVSKVTVAPVASDDTARASLMEASPGEEAVLNKVADIQSHIAEGSVSFLFTVYKYMFAFMILMSAVVFLLLGSENNFSMSWTDKDGNSVTPSFYNGLFSTISFNLGALTSIASGYFGMKIATYANARVAVEARKGIAPAFEVAFRSGSVMGFLLTSMGLIVLYITLLAFRSVYGPHSDWTGLFEAITGYGLGGSSIALFGRVGGGIYTKAADVGADLVGKVEKDIPEDDPRNPGVIADNVGDNVGDIAGMGADLFGSFAESTCAALVVASVSSIGEEHNWTGMMFPLGITAAGIVVCLLTTLLATDIAPAQNVPGIEPALKTQLVVSTALMTPVVGMVAFFSLPTSFTIPNVDHDIPWWYMFICVSVGLWGGLIIGLVTEYYTSNAYKPVQEVANACRTGAATNVIFGLALGYLSCIIPVFVIASAIFTGFTLAGMYGIACAALGMLATMSTGLAIDAYGPISDNAGGIAEMAGMGDDIREKTDALDAAGNTTAAIGKGFAIGSAALVSLALFGAYITRTGITAEQTSILDARVFCGLLIGAMLPYWFSAMTMKSVGDAALAMVEEVRRQFQTIAGLMEGTAEPDYKRCVAISTDASLREMIAPGALVMLSPIIVGTFFGTRALAGLLAGALVSGVQMAISMSNTGGAWDNAKKYIEAGRSAEAQELGPKGSDAHKAAVIGDTVGDPLKDTSGPSLNILIKLMAVESLVFAPFFASKLCGDGDGMVAKWLGFAG